jgi:hypothetical protein
MKKIIIIFAFSCLMVTFAFSQDQPRLKNDSLIIENITPQYFKIQDDSLLRKFLLDLNGSINENKLFYLSEDILENNSIKDKMPFSKAVDIFPMNIMKPEGVYPMYIMKPDSSQHYSLLIKKY